MLLAGLRPCPEAIARCAARSLASGAGQIFFHQSEAPAGGAALGDALSFRVRADARSGKPVAVALRRLEPGELEPELRQPGGASRGRWNPGQGLSMRLVSETSLHCLTQAPDMQRLQCSSQLRGAPLHPGPCAARCPQTVSAV